MELTKSEEQVLISISEYINENEYSPSIRDIASDLNKGTATIYTHLKKLKEKGYIDYEEGKSRTIRIK